MTNKGEAKGIERRLDLIASLLTTIVAQGGGKASPSVTDRILVLQDTGLKPAEIAAVIGKTTNYVSGILSQKRKAAVRKTRRVEDNEQ